MRKAQIVIVDDHKMVRESLARVLGDVCAIVALAGGAEDLFAALKRSMVDCVVLDLDMPGVHGIQLLKLIRSRYPRVRVVIATMHSDLFTASIAMGEGASGYVPKDAGVAELQFAIGEVCGGRTYISPRLSPAKHRIGLKASHPGLSRLTPRQQEIVLLIGEGKSAARIAEKLGVGQSTITFHKQNAMRQLGLHSHDALFQFAVFTRNSLSAVEVSESRE